MTERASWEIEVAFASYDAYLYVQEYARKYTQGLLTAQEALQWIESVIVKRNIKVNKILAEEEKARTFEEDELVAPTTQP